MLSSESFGSVGLILGSSKQTTDDIVNTTNPWAISPNITENKNGKVMQANTLGFTSLYLGIAYISVIIWKGAVKSFNVNEVGGESPL